LVTDGRGRQRFLAKSRDQHWVVADEVGQDDFYCVRRFEKDVAGLKHHTHTALSQSSLQLIASIEYGLAQERWRGLIAVLRTVVNFVRETAPTGWTFFHLGARYKADDGRRISQLQKVKVAVAG
jgi:hypothetical protein